MTQNDKLVPKTDGASIYANNKKIIISKMSTYKKTNYHKNQLISYMTKAYKDMIKLIFEKHVIKKYIQRLKTMR